MNYSGKGNVEEIYKQNFELEHSPIFDVMVFVEDEEDGDEYFEGTIEVFGNGYERRHYYSWSPDRMIATTTLSDFPLNLDALCIEDGMIVANFYIEKIKISFRDFLLLRNYLEIMDPKYVEDLNFKTEADDKIDWLLDDNEIRTTIENFIDQFPTELFVTSKLFVEQEQVLKYKFDVNERFLLSSELQRTLYAPIKYDEDEFEYEVLSNNVDFINNYFDTEFEYLNDFIYDKLHYLAENSEDITWRKFFIVSKKEYLTFIAINKVVYRKFAAEWEDLYSFAFENICEMTLEEAIDAFFSLDTVDKDNLIQDGKFICFLMQKNIFSKNDNFFECWSEYEDQKDICLAEHKKKSFLNRISSKNVRSEEQKVSMNDVDLMNGTEFENFVATLFTKLGYSASVTKQTGDQGIDVIAEKNGLKIGIQAKCYSGAVGNSAVQEAVAGKNHYKLDKAIVVTNNTFTKSAIELASSNDVILWDRGILKEKL